MITAREKIKQCSNSMFVKEESELVDRLVYALHEYTKEAIKEDRINLLNHISLTEFAQEFLQEGASDAIDEESIINAPNIKLL